MARTTSEPRQADAVKRGSRLSLTRQEAPNVPLVLIDSPRGKLADSCLDRRTNTGQAARSHGARTRPKKGPDFVFLLPLCFHGTAEGVSSRMTR